MSILPSRAQTLFRDLPWADACHAAVVSAAPAIMAVLTGEPRLGWSAIAAFWACFADPGGPLAQRLRAMCWVAAIGALFCFLGSAAKDTLWLLLPLTFICCTLASFAQAWGPAAAIIGTLVSAGFVVSTELPTPTVASSAAYAAFFVGGGVWAIVMTAVVWRRRPWRHATVAVAACYAELANYARALGLLYLPSRTRHTRTSESSEISTVHRKALRALIDRARNRIHDIQSSRPSRMNRARQLTALLDASERAFIVLVALADTMASLADVDQAAPICAPGSVPLAIKRVRDASILRALHRFAQACEVTASLSNIDDPAQQQRLHAALARTDQAVRQAHAAVLPGDTVMPTLLPLLDSLFSAGADGVSALVTGATAFASTNESVGGHAGHGANPSQGRHCANSTSHDSNNTSDRGSSKHSNAQVGTVQNWGLAAAWRTGWRQLRQSLDLQSGITRHAIRVGVAATTSVALCRIFHINHGYWMSLTVVFILQPFLASTWQRTAERVAGSVAGAVGASIVGLLLPSPLAVALAVLPIAIGTFVGRTIHYAIFTFFLTLQFVLVAEIQQPASHEFTLAALRATNSVYGGILAILIGLLLWPERSQQRLATVLAEAVDRHAAYVQQVLRSAQGEGFSSALGSLRRDACLSADNAQVVLQGLLRSPLHRRQNAAAVSELIASLRGMTAAATVLELQPLSTTAKGANAPNAANVTEAAEAGEALDVAGTAEASAAEGPTVTTDQIGEYAQAVAISMSNLATRIRDDALQKSPHKAPFTSADPSPPMPTGTAAEAAAEAARPLSAAPTSAVDVKPPAALLRPADPRSLALQRISTLVAAISGYPSPTVR